MVTFSYEIKRHLLLGRKAMANLDSILKSRDITIAGLYNHSHGFSSEMKWSESCLVMSNSLWPHGLYRTWNSPGQNTRVSSLSFLQGIFPSRGLNPGLPQCRQIFYQLNHQGTPRILECVAYPFSRGPSRPRNRTQGLMHCRRILFQLSHQESPHFRESYLKRKKFSTEGTN